MKHTGWRRWRRSRVRERSCVRRGKAPTLCCIGMAFAGLRSSTIGNKRIFRLLLLVGVSLVHGVMLLVWNRRPPPPLPPPLLQPIPVLILSAPAAPAPRKAAKAPAAPAHASPETPPHRKKRRTRRRAKSPPGPQVSAVTLWPPGGPDTSPYGVWTVRPQGGGRSALSIFMRGFDCARLSPQYGRPGCPPAPVNLVRGMEGKIATIAAMEDRGLHSPYGPRLRRREGSRGPVFLRGRGGVGHAASDDGLERIPPSHPDPSFGD